MNKVKISDLKPFQNNARTHSDRQIKQIAKSIKEFGFVNPILADKDNHIIAGHGRYAAAKQLNIEEVPVVYIEHMNDIQKRAYMLADNRLAEKAGWDKDILAIELQNLINIDTDFDLTLTGFETPEIDIILHSDSPKNDKIDDFTDLNIIKRVKFGEIWQLGSHKLLCGDSLALDSYEALLEAEKADIIVSDPPFNVKVDGHIRSRGTTNHKEFAMASGEMSEGEFEIFLQTAFGNMTKYSKDGSLHYVFMDWRHVAEMMQAGKAKYTAFKNICVWNKMSGGMGSLYRSQHELVFVFKNGSEQHTNNIELGKHGRYRTNVWDYPGIFINNKVNKENIKLHPTVKPVGLLADILLDASKRGDIVLDPFGGSGSTLLAAERTKRKARIIEIDPHYCDVTLHRWEKITKQHAVLIKGGH